MAGDPKSLLKLTPNGQVDSLGSKPAPKAGPMKGLDASRYGSARNTSKDYTNPKSKLPPFKGR